jgi:hypothetical protein
MEIGDDRTGRFLPYQAQILAMNAGSTSALFHRVQLSG